MKEISQQDQYKLHPQEGWWEEADHSQGRDPACRFGGPAGAERRSAEPGAMDDQIDEQAQGSTQEPGTYNWRDRHSGAFKGDGIFPQSEQEGDRGNSTCGSRRPISADQSNREGLRSGWQADDF